MKQTVSVALATYNGERYLAEQLDSIASQSQLPDELIVGDDRSTDSTERVVREFAQKVPFAVHFSCNEERLGSSQNFASLLARCQGDVILLSDQDDRWSELRVARSLEVLRANPEAGYAFSNASLIDEHGKPLAGALWQRAFFGARAQQRFAEQRGHEVLLKSNVVTGATMAIRRSALATALPIPLGWVHDGWLAFVLELTHGAVAVDEPWIAYRVHAAQQIGVVGWSPQSLLRTMRRQDAQFYRGEASNYRALSAKLRELGGTGLPVAERAREKAAFLELRARGREDLAMSLVGLAKALRQRSYQRYGLGAKQAALDVISAWDSAARRALAR
jgi:glycosyltransferase involved in cell wall biosynthesis